MTAGKSHVFCFSLKIFMIFLFYVMFHPSKSRFYRKLSKRKTQSKTAGKSQSKMRDDNRKIAFSFPVKIFMFFLFYVTFLPSKSRFSRKLYKRKT